MAQSPLINKGPIFSISKNNGRWKPTVRFRICIVLYWWLPLPAIRLHALVRLPYPLKTKATHFSNLFAFPFPPLTHHRPWGFPKIYNERSEQNPTIQPQYQVCIKSTYKCLNAGVIFKPGHMSINDPICDFWPSYSILW